MVPSEISSYWLYITPTPLLKERSSVIKSNLVSLFTVVHRSPESKPTGAVSLDVSLVSVHGAHCKLSLERKFVGQQYLSSLELGTQKPCRTLNVLSLWKRSRHV